MPRNSSFVVGTWVVEPDLDQISRGAERKTLRPQVMSLLMYLAERDGQLCRSEDLFKDLWPNKVVTDGTLYNCIAELRHQLDEEADSPASIQTIPKKGYRLTGNNRFSPAAADTADNPTESTTRRTLRKLSSMIVTSWAYELIPGFLPGHTN